MCTTIYLLVFSTSFLSLQGFSDAAINKAVFHKENLNCHNKYRALHQVENLKYDPELQKAAQKYADQLAKQDMGLIHEKNTVYGENLYFMSGKDIKGADACKAWYEENKKYTYGQKDPSNFSQIGHFTQLVWKGTKTTGIGVAQSKSGSVYVVAKYLPPGNYMGEYDTNVLPPK